MKPITFYLTKSSGWLCGGMELNLLLNTKNTYDSSIGIEHSVDSIKSININEQKNQIIKAHKMTKINMFIVPPNTNTTICN